MDGAQGVGIVRQRLLRRLDVAFAALLLSAHRASRRCRAARHHALVHPRWRHDTRTSHQPPALPPAARARQRMTCPCLQLHDDAPMMPLNTVSSFFCIGRLEACAKEK